MQKAPARSPSSQRDEPEDKHKKALIRARRATRKAILKVVGYCLRISCCTPVLGPCLGCIGVGFASALAGQASLHTQKLFQAGGNPLRLKWWDPIDMDDALLDAVMGIIIFKATGGRFRSLMPSDLVAPGALAFESIPARSEEYAKPGVKRELARIFRRDGCHHCGSRKGPVIGDHMPPNKVVYSKGAGQLEAWFKELPVIRQVRALTGAKDAPPRQRFYPQCQKCSYKQATALRHNKRVLVLHVHTPRYRSENLTGIFVALRHNVPPFQPPGGKQRQGPRWAPLALTAALAPTSIPLMVGPTSLDTCASTTELDFGMPTCSTGVIERQQSALMTRAASEAALAAAAARSASGVGGAAGGSSGVEMLQQREDVEAQRARDNGGGDEHQKLGSELLASFQHWMPNQPQQGAVHYRHQQQGGQFVGHMQQGAHAAGAGAEVGPMYHRPSNDAEAEADARSYGDHGHAGMGEQTPADAKLRAHAAFQRHFTPGLSY